MAIRGNSYIMVRGARQLLTLRGGPGPRRGSTLRQLGIIQDGAVLFREGRIEAVGLTRRIENLKEARHARVIDASGRVVMPGFVDSHTHLVSGPPRLADYELRIGGGSYQDIAQAGGGIQLTVRSVRDAPLSTLAAQAERLIGGFLRHGTTTIEAKSGYGLDESGERKSLRVVHSLDGRPLDLVATYLGAHIVPPEYQGRADDYIEWMCRDFMPRLRHHKLAVFADVYCEQGAYTVRQARRYLQCAREQGFLLKLHAEQFSRTGATLLGVELGAVSVDHLDYIGDEEIRALAAADTIATLLPGAVLHLGLHHYPPARALIGAGAAVALATDCNPGTSPTYSMPMVLSLACSQMRMTPAEAIAAATINAAHACRRARRAGSLESGKDADLILLDVPDYREIPYHFGVNLVAMTIKRGAILFDLTRQPWPAA